MVNLFKDLVWQKTILLLNTDLRIISSETAETEPHNVNSIRLCDATEVWCRELVFWRIILLVSGAIRCYST